MEKDENRNNRIGGFRRSGSSFKRFVLIIGIATVVSLIGIFSSVFFMTQNEDLLPPAIIVQPANPVAGSSVFVQGSGFAPGDEVRILLNDGEISETAPEVVIADNFGAFNAEVVIPPETEGANRIEAMDESGNNAETTIRTMDE